MKWIDELRRLLSRSGSHPSTERPAEGGISCTEAAERVFEWLDGELDEEMSDRVGIHLKTCARCYPFLVFEEAFQEAIRRVEPVEAAPARASWIRSNPRDSAATDRPTTESRENGRGRRFGNPGTGSRIPRLWRGGTPAPPTPFQGLHRYRIRSIVPARPFSRFCSWPCPPSAHLWRPRRRSRSRTNASRNSRRPVRWSWWTSGPPGAHLRPATGCARRLPGRAPRGRLPHSRGGL
jgi:hypothetical protein